MLLALLILTALGILATTALVVSMSDRRFSNYERDSLQALATAESGVAYAKRAIVNETAPIGDYDDDGRPDFVLADSTSWGGTYSVVAEGVDVLSEGVVPYFCNGFTILSEGRYHGAIRRVKVEIAHDTYLKFARFCGSQPLQFECGDLLTGEVYSGQSINLACGCPAGTEPHFLEKVSSEGSIPQAHCGLFDEGYEEHVGRIDILGSLDLNEMRNRARGLSTNNSCEGTGNIGIYIDLPGTDPLSLGSQPGTGYLDTVVFDYFDFMDTTTQPGDTIVTYNGATVMNTVTGTALERGDFNGIIFFEGDARLRGRLDGVSAFGVTVFGTDHGLIQGDVITGHTGFDPGTRLPNGSGEPITAAVVAENYVAMDRGSCRILRIDLAIFSRTSNWRAIGGVDQHPEGGPGPLDLDLDEVWGETPYNNDPLPGEGWDEQNITPHHWVLNLTGPLITYVQGDAWPWNAGPVLGNASGPTHRAEMDLDFWRSPPPCFPVPRNLWVDVSWTEIFDSRGDLANHLPH